MKNLKRIGDTVFDISDPKHPKVIAYRCKGDWYDPATNPREWVVIEGHERAMLEEALEAA